MYCDKANKDVVRIEEGFDIMEKEGNEIMDKLIIILFGSAFVLFLIAI